MTPDPLAPLRDRFHIPDGVIYLDGNSLGLKPKGVDERVAAVVAEEWGNGLIRSWTEADWINLPLTVGAQIAPLIGAAAHEVVVGDSTSVNLFKCLCAALAERPDRNVIVMQADDFPTDGYIAQGVADVLPGSEIRAVADPGSALADDVAALLLTHVNYKSAAIHDMAGLTRAAHDAGALTVWDLSHSTGAMPLDVRAAGVDFAVGCTYKYLNGGPGAPAFTYVAERLADRVRQPLSGWMGHARPFDFAPGYEPAAGAKRFLTGTPQIISLAALSEALTVWDGIDMGAVRRKSIALTSLFIELVERECAGFGLRLMSPREPERRGSHVAIGCDHGWPVVRALAERGVIGDFRAPDLTRFGFAPLYTSFADLEEAVRILKEILETEAWRAPRFAGRLAVT